NDVLYLMDNLGIETGINEDELLKAAFYIQNKLGKNLPSRSLTYELSQMSEGIDSDVLSQKHRRKRDMMYDFLKYQYEIFKKIAKIFPSRLLTYKMNKMSEYIDSDVLA